jgi:hypothetical protein
MPSRPATVDRTSLVRRSAAAGRRHFPCHPGRSLSCRCAAPPRTKTTLTMGYFGKLRGYFQNSETALLPNGIPTAARNERNGGISATASARNNPSAPSISPSSGMRLRGAPSAWTVRRRAPRATCLRLLPEERDEAASLVTLAIGRRGHPAGRRRSR